MDLREFAVWACSRWVQREEARRELFWRVDGQKLDARMQEEIASNSKERCIISRED